MIEFSTILVHCYCQTAGFPLGGIVNSESSLLGPTYTTSTSNLARKFQERLQAKALEAALAKMVLLVSLALKHQRIWPTTYCWTFNKTALLLQWLDNSSFSTILPSKNLDLCAGHTVKSDRETGAIVMAFTGEDRE